MLTKKGERSAARIAQEAVWFEQGREAERIGLDLRDWPRHEKKYSIDWYRMKNAWQEGWRAQSMGDGVPERVEEQPESLNSVLLGLIRKHAPIAQRKLLTRLTNTNRKAAAVLLGEWKANSSLRFSGTGKRGNPIVIEGLD